jgi:hypothetical protein
MITTTTKVNWRDQRDLGVEYYYKHIIIIDSFCGLNHNNNKESFTDAFLILSFSIYNAL